MRLVLSFLLLVCVLSTAPVHALTPEQMMKHILAVGEDVVQDQNVVEFNYRGLGIVLIYDLKADRMRLVSPIIEAKNVGNDVLMMALEANYHSALDARYAVSNNVVWSVFIHPLSDLSPALFDSAISQVAIARATFGDQFTSGALVFPSGSQ